MLCMSPSVIEIIVKEFFTFRQNISNRFTRREWKSVAVLWLDGPLMLRCAALANCKLRGRLCVCCGNFATILLFFSNFNRAYLVGKIFAAGAFKLLRAYVKSLNTVHVFLQKFA